MMDISALTHDDGYKLLVQETLNYAPELSGRNPFESDEENAPDGPGLIYSLQKGVSSFTLKMQLSTNIKEDLEKLDFSARSFRYFATPYIELAEVILEQLRGRRFPLHEEAITDLASPSSNWWGRIAPDGGLNVCFRCHLPNGDGSYQKLGPLGDYRVAFARFKTIINELHPYFKFKEIICDEREFLVRPEDFEHIHFKLLQRLFLKGEFSKELDTICQKYLTKTSYYYLREVASLRSFWSNIEFQLSL